MFGINRRNIWHDKNSNPELTAWERCYPNPIAVILEKKKKRQFWFENKTRLPASTGIFFAWIQIFWSTFANSQKWDYCLKIGFQRSSTIINSTTDFYILSKSATLSQYRKISLGDPFVFQKAGLKNFTHITIFCRQFFVSQYPKKCFGTIRFIGKIRVSKKLFEKGGSRFSVESFRLTVPKNSVGEPFCVSENFWYRKVLCIGGGESWSRKFFVSQDRKNS